MAAGFSSMTELIKRRDVLKAGVTGALALALKQKTFAAEPPQRFKIGIAATEWLARDHSVAGYWKAADAISALGVGATEADNGDAQLDSAYGAKPLAFRQLSQRAGVRLLGVYQAMLLHDRAKLPEMLAKIRSDGRFLKAIGAEYIAPAGIRLRLSTAKPTNERPRISARPFAQPMRLAGSLWKKTAS